MDGQRPRSRRSRRATDVSSRRTKAARRTSGRRASIHAPVCWSSAAAVHCTRGFCHPSSRSLMSDNPSSYTHSRWFNSLNSLSEVASKIAVISGVIIGLVQLASIKRGWDASNQAAKLQSLQYIQSFINRDFEIQNRITVFEDEKQATVLEAKVRQGPTRSLYFSDKKPLGDLPDIGEHYE